MNGGRAQPWQEMPMRPDQEAIVVGHCAKCSRRGTSYRVVWHAGVRYLSWCPCADVRIGVRKSDDPLATLGLALRAVAWAEGRYLSESLKRIDKSTQLRTALDVSRVAKPGTGE
jgi:hypothetical protein